MKLERLDIPPETPTLSEKAEAALYELAEENKRANQYVRKGR
jgi:hypothetical protein